MMSDRFDVAVVGAGPAGLAAAVHAAAAGCQVVLVDSAQQPGGQYWRHPDEAGPHGAENSGQHGWATFQRLRARLRQLREHGRVSYVSGRHVWFVEKLDQESPGHRLHLTQMAGTTHDPEAPHQVTAASLILCPGGYDRQLPIDGWDLPGVMAAGGVQALLKEHRVCPGSRAIVAGTGPFLLPVAEGLAQSGVHVVAVCEANSPTGWLRDPYGAMSVPSKAVEAAGYLATLTRHRIPYRTRTAITEIEGSDHVRAATLSKLDRRGTIRHTVTTKSVDLVAMGWGFTPSLELATAAGVETTTHDSSLIVTVDALQRCSVAGVYAAGEVTGVGGAALAVAEGELAGAAAASDLNHAVQTRRLSRLTRSIARFRRFANAMAQAHPVPPAWPTWLTEDTTVCRCEEVTVGDLEAVRDDLGAEDVRTVKLLARPGMGWCQGRVCGFASACLATTEPGALTGDQLRPVAKRPLCAPVPLRQLAGDEHDV